MSTATSSSRMSSASAGIADGLRENRREYEAASSIKEDTKMIVARLRALGQQGELLADGGVGSFVPTEASVWFPILTLLS